MALHILNSTATYRTLYHDGELDLLLPCYYFVSSFEAVHDLFITILLPKLIAQPNNVLLFHDRNQRKDRAKNKGGVYCY